MACRLCSNSNFRMLPCPKVYMSSPEGLVMQKLEGITAAEAIAGWKQEGAQNDLFGREQRDVVYSAFAEMVLKHGFF